MPDINTLKTGDSLPERRFEPGQLLSIEYSNRQASYIGDVLTSGGTIKSINISDGTIELDIFVKNQRGDVLTPGVAIVRI